MTPFIALQNSAFTQKLFIQGVSFVLPRCEIVVTGDAIEDDGTQAIIIANHQVDADWWYIWWLLRANDQQGYLKVILKDMSYIPFIGWGLKVCGIDMM